MHDDATLPAGVTPPQTGPRERPPAFADGSVLANRYRLVRFIARGGMGEVYEALDLELGEHVALKTIHPDRVGDRGAVERFKREIFLARKVTHRNVCRLFDVGFHESTTFLTMELLQGDTLAARIRQLGRYAPADALPIVQQMAAALDAAHAAGIVHRDFKSPNVILCGSRAVVTDFGLARGTQATDESLSRSGEIIGSPGYMAPEQVEGRAAGPAADVYALGVVLFEMVTGKLPFVADTPMATAIKRLRQKAPSPREAASDLDATWEQAILRCMELKPEDRFPSAGAVARALEQRMATGLESTHALALPPVRRWRWMAIPLALAVAAAAYFAWPRAKSSIVQTSAGRRAVAVVGFRNTTGRADAAWLGSALSEMLATELGATETLRAVPAETVARVKLELGLGEADSLAPETLARLRKNTGADLVVIGSYVALGNKVRVDLHLQDAVAGQTVASLSETGEEAALFDLVERAGGSLRQRMGAEPVPPAALSQVRATVPQNSDAAKSYAEGLARARIYDLTGARTLLAKATQAEPGFALAHSALADVLWELGYERDARAEARKALDAAADLPREDRLLVEARHERMTGEQGKALDIYGALHRFFPDDLEHGVDLMHAQIAAGKPKEALATLDELRKLAPPLGDDPRLDLAEADAVADSDFHRAQTAAERAAQKAQAQGARLLLAQARRAQGTALANLGKHQDALAAFEEARKMREALGDRGGAAVEVINMAVQRGALGDPDADLQLCADALAICREIGDRIHEVWALGEIGAAHHDKNEVGLARESWEQARTLAHELGRTADEANFANNLAVMLMRTGDVDGALAHWDDVLSAARETGTKNLEATTQFNIGAARLRKGDLSPAKWALGESLRLRHELGDAAGQAWAEERLAAVAVEQADLDGAQKHAEHALAIAKQPELTARIHLVLADAARERNDEVAAQKHITQARTLAQQAKKDEVLAMCDLLRATLALDAADAKTAAELARSAADNFGRQGNHRHEASARALAARAGATDEADRAATALGPHPIYPEAFAVALARGRAAQEQAAADARRLGFVRWQLELDLARGKTADVQRLARSKGMQRLADRAATMSHAKP